MSQYTIICDFLKRNFNARVSKGKFKFSIYKPLFHKFNSVTDTIETKTEDSIDISLTEENFYKLARILSEKDAYSSYESFLHLRETKERMLRDKYPSVNKAYENYQLLIKTVDNHEL